MSPIDPDDRTPLGRDELIERLRGWFSEGRSRQARYLLVAQDVFDYLRPDYDYGLYPEYAASSKELQELLEKDARRKSDSLDDRIVDAFDLERDLDEQLREPSRTEFHFLR